MPPEQTHLAWLDVAALSAAAMAAIILVWFLVRRPPLSRVVKVALLLGIGVFPIGAALVGNVSGYQRTMSRSFCGSCHTMEPWTSDAANPHSLSLAAIHSRSKEFGAESCYRCHQNYEMFGTIATKANGMRHVWMYYTDYKDVPNDVAVTRIALYQPFPNGTCMQCHSTETPRWLAVPEHESTKDLARSGKLGCATAGCHGPAHPFATPPGGPR